MRLEQEKKRATLEPPYAPRPRMAAAHTSHALLHPRSESSVCCASNTPSGGLPTRTTIRKDPGRGTSTSRPVRLATRHRVFTGTGMHVATVSQLTYPPSHTHPTPPSPAMTRLPDTFGHYIDVYKQAREATTEFEFEQSEGGYLFASRDGRPFSVSSWTSVVKETFRRHSGLAPPPKLLRAIFIVWLRDEAHHKRPRPTCSRVVPS